MNGNNPRYKIGDKVMIIQGERDRADFVPATIVDVFINLLGNYVYRVTVDGSSVVVRREEQVYKRYKD